MSWHFWVIDVLALINYLLKPIGIEQLVSKIEKAACRKRHRDQLILEVYMKSYPTRREQEEQIAQILDTETKNGVA